MKYFAIIALVVVGLGLGIGAEAAKELARGVIIGTVKGVGLDDMKVYKITDEKTSCYVVASLYGPSISCVK